MGNPNDGFANPRPWGQNPQEPPPPPPPPPYEYGGGNGFVGEADRNFKRPRVDDFGAGVSGSEFNPSPAGFSWDDERRLKLIREHGSVQSRHPEVGSNSVVDEGYRNPACYNTDDRRHVKEGDLAHEQQYMHNRSNGSHADTREEHYGLQHHPMKRDVHAYGQPPLPEVSQGAVGNRHGVAARGTSYMYEPPGGFFPRPGGGSLVPESMGHMKAPRLFGGQPPLPASPPPPLPMEPSLPSSLELKAYSSQPMQPKMSLFPVPVSSSAMMSSSSQPTSEAQSLPRPYFHAKTFMHASTTFVTEVLLSAYRLCCIIFHCQFSFNGESLTLSQESQAFHGAVSKQFVGENQPFPLKQSPLDKPTVVDASHIFKQPLRASRPDHFVIILRGLPGN